MALINENTFKYFRWLTAYFQVLLTLMILNFLYYSSNWAASYFLQLILTFHWILFSLMCIWVYKQVINLLRKTFIIVSIFTVKWFLILTYQWKIKQKCEINFKIQCRMIQKCIDRPCKNALNSSILFCVKENWIMRRH